MEFEKVIFGHVTIGMALSFTIGIVCLFSYAWSKNKKTKDGYSVKNYMDLTIPNIVFHIISSLLVLLLLHEISDTLIKNFIPQLDGSKTYEMTLSAFTGMFGSVIVAWVLEKKRRLVNKNDENIVDIKHFHDDNCNHDVE